MIPLTKNNNKHTKIPPSISESKIEIVIEAVFDKFSQGIRIIGPLFAFALTIFVIISAHAVFHIMVPYYVYYTHWISGILISAMTLFLLLNILFNYFLCVLVRPGSLDDIRRSKFYQKKDPLTVDKKIINLEKVWQSDANQRRGRVSTEKINDKAVVDAKVGCTPPSMTEYIEDLPLFSTNNTNEASERIQISDGSTSIPINSSVHNTTNTSNTEYTDTTPSFRLNDCKYCKQHKPLRSHHCQICGYCVFKMDHHCPWINNCVGQNNHRYFVLFLTYLLFGCIFVSTLSLPMMFNSSFRKSNEFSFVSVLCIVGTFLMIFFNSWNWFLVLRGNTTIEYWSLKSGLHSESPIKDFSLNDWRENLFIVFGTRSVLRALMPSIKRLPYSGLEWTKLALQGYQWEQIEYVESGSEGNGLGDSMRLKVETFDDEDVV